MSSGDLLRVLADPLREQIVRLLARETLCNCHLAEETGASQTNISNHLRQLRAAGLVVTEPHGRYTYYRLQPNALRALAATLTDLADTAETNAATRRPCP
jgi:ArsR family transcriptional regulator